MKLFKKLRWAQPTPPRQLNVVTLVLALAASGIVGCTESPDDVSATSAPELPVIEARVLAVELQPWPQIIRSHGSLIADETAVIGSRLEGRVDQVHVDLGDAVKAGTPLVTLKQAEFRLRVEQAEAQLLQTRSAVGLEGDEPVSDLNPENAPPVREQKALWVEAQGNVDRARQLRERNTISPVEFEQIAANAAVTEARYKAVLNSVREKIALIGVREAELSLARESLMDTVIRVPFDGFLQQRQVSPGTYVRVGDSVGTVVRTDDLRFRGTIPERYARSLAPGQPVQLQIESMATPLVVKITRISPALDVMSRSLLFEALIENSDQKYRSGLFAEARIIVNEFSKTIAIPASALLEFAGAEKVWKVVNGETREQQVLAGERRDNLVEIKEGLAVGDVILQEVSQGIRARVIPINVLPDPDPRFSESPLPKSDPDFSNESPASTTASNTVTVLKPPSDVMTVSEGTDPPATESAELPSNLPASAPAPALTTVPASLIDSAANSPGRGISE